MAVRLVKPRWGRLRFRIDRRPQRIHWAALGHHQQDSTHIATNVITFGLSAGPVQVEASTFHGREPNENRWNIDKGKPDSFATRLTIAATKSLSAQVSTGRLNNPEAADPLLDVVRTTASLHHNLQFSSGHQRR